MSYLTSTCLMRDSGHAASTLAPFPCPAANDACPALEPLPEDECPPKEASMNDCVGFECEYGCQPMTLESHGLEEFYQVGTVCERVSHAGEDECGTSSNVNNCFGHSGDKDGDFYRVVQGGPDCPYLEATRCPNDVDALPSCTSKCLDENEICGGTGLGPEHCGASEGECYKVTSTKFMSREGCDGTGGSSKKKSSSNDAGLIAGVAIASVAALLLLAAITYCCCRRSSSPAKSRREAPPSPQMSNPVVEKASRRDPDEQLEFQGGELR